MTIDTQTQTWRAPRLRRLLALITATAAALVIWFIASSVAHVSLTVHTGTADTTVGPAAVIAASLVAGLAAWASLAILERLTRKPRLVWTINTAIALAISLTGPLSSATSRSAAFVLVSLHLCVAAILIGLLGRTARRG